MGVLYEKGKKISCVIVPLAISSIIFIFFNTLDSSTFYRISPILGEDLKTTLFIDLNNLFVFNFITYYYFLIPLLKKKSDFSKVSKYTLIISSII